MSNKVDLVKEKISALMMEQSATILLIQEQLALLSRGSFGLINLFCDIERQKALPRNFFDQKANIDTGAKALRIIITQATMGLGQLERYRQEIEALRQEQ